MVSGHDFLFCANLLSTVDLLWFCWTYLPAFLGFNAGNWLHFQAVTAFHHFQGDDCV